MSAASLEKKMMMPHLAAVADHIHTMDHNTSTVVRTTRDAPPTGYLMKIEPFSSLSHLLKNSSVDKYESNEFKAQGYKWRLVVYPNGNKKCDGEGCISLYVALVDAKRLAFGSEVKAILKFFVLDQIKGKYVTVEVSSFSGLKRERGISQLLSLSTFTDSSSGYLIDDCCTFGVEITVIDYQERGEKLTIVKAPDDGTFSWKIDESLWLNDEQSSKEFTLGGCKWKLNLYSTDDSVKGKNMSIFLYVRDTSTLRLGWKVNLDFKLIIEDQVHGKDFEGRVSAWFSASSTSWACKYFMPLKDLYDEKKGYVVKGAFIAKVEIDSISVVNCFC